jgi:small ligand-binding sensory domain FIST
MGPFIVAHATHHDAHMALALAAAQIDGQRAQRPQPYAASLGLVYLTDALAGQADAVLAELQQRWPGVHWAGAMGAGVMVSGVEYMSEPALVLMLCDLPEGSFQVFNGRTPLASHNAHCALVHADPSTPDLDDLITELADRTHSGYLFGGLSASLKRCCHLADGVFDGGLSGVAFAPPVSLISRVTQGCQPLGPVRRITSANHNLVVTLDDQPALPLLLDALGVSLDHPQRAMAALRRTLVGLTDVDDDALARGGQFGVDTRVRHLIGIDPANEGIAIADHAEPGQQLAFCRRDVTAARRDLVRICAEIREELAGDGDTPARQIAGAIYVSCSGRGGPHFGSASAEAQIVQHALGDVPLVGFFAAGEIAHRHLYGYTGVLTVFATE